jgi:pyruvate dehydrogenase E2 component (dihydrolipoamide acetyltransferase)
MATKVVMEALSPTMEEGRLVKWLKNEGDPIANGDVLAEVETDKAVMELVARGEGVLRKRLLAEGQTAPVRQLIAIIGSADENIDALVGGAAASAPAAAPAAAAPPAKAQEAASAAPVATPPATAPPAAPQHASTPATQPNGGQSKSSPLARRLASERGLDLSRVQGSGPGGRIIKRDIEQAVASGGAAQPAARAAGAPRSDAPYEDVPLTQIRKTIARRLSESIGPIPTFYLTAELDLTRVTELRAAMLEMGDEYKVSVNDILLKAVATALSQHPEVNAHWLGDHIRYFSGVHLGMAVATDDGLIVPVIFDAHLKRMSEISREAKELAKRARDRKLTPDQYTGSTFSVSNLGMFGIDQFTAIINPPETAILAIGTAEQKLILVDGEAVPRTRLRVTMSCDHRVIDGAVGARFLQTLRRMVENPLMLVF